MEKGAYIVSASKINEYDIEFAVKPEVTEVPEAQRSLHFEVEKTLTVLRTLFEKDKAVLTAYFRQLLTLAQAGLVPDNAQPSISLKALEQLKYDIVHRVSGEIKNTYFKHLGLQAIKVGQWPAYFAVFVKILFFYFSSSVELKNLNILSHFMIIWSACMLGVWLSFGARKTILTFDELTTIEEDRLEPVMRLLFAGCITLVFAVLFYTKAVEIKIGPVASADIKTDMFTSMIFGVFLGLSEQVLGKKITKKAATVLDKI